MEVGLDVVLEDVPDTDHFDIMERMVDGQYHLTQVDRRRVTGVTLVISYQRCSQVYFCKSKSSLKSLVTSPSQVSSLCGVRLGQVSSLWSRVQVKSQVSKK